MEIVRATREEVAAVEALLRESGLAPLPPQQPLSDLWVAREAGAVAGAIALEIVGRRGLLRSAVVAPSHRGRGLGADLISRLVSRAHELGLRDLWLLTETETAEAFFAKCGFERIAREEVPQEIRSTRHFAKQCPESAVAMRLPLETRW